MSTTEARPEGMIGLCPHNNCGFICCDFAVGNYIVLHPGELEQAQQQGHSTDHLEIAEGHLGGYKAVCVAKDTSTCDNGYKPLDCACYPFFPTINKAGEIEAGIKGSKCPLQVAHLTQHRNWVVSAWNQVAQRVDGIVEWIRHTRLVGYERVKD
ncbi:MAG: hypothetical protein RIC55_30835 [Pirellulaceae bacterium]